MIPTLAVAQMVVGLAVAAFILVCLLMILTVLIQRPQGGGLAGAFGSGAGSGQTAFGAKTGDALTVFTIIVFVVYVLGAIGLNIIVAPPTPGGETTATSTTPAETPANGTTGQGTTEGTTQPATTTTPAPAAPESPAPASTPAPVPASETPAPQVPPSDTPGTPAAPPATPPQPGNPGGN